MVNKKLITFMTAALVAVSSLTPAFAAENNNQAGTTTAPAIETTSGSAVNTETASGTAVSSGSAVTSGPAVTGPAINPEPATGSSVTTGPAVTGPAVEPGKPSEPSEPEEPEEPSKPVKPVKKTYKTGDKITSGGLNYVITSAKNKTVKVTGMTSKSFTHVIVPGYVKYKRTYFKVTKIENQAFINCTRLKKVTVGINVEKIGKEAFKGCSRLKAITVLSQKLTSVGANALYGTNYNLKITVYKKCYYKYTKLFKNKGLITVKVVMGNK